MVPIEIHEHKNECFLLIWTIYTQEGVENLAAKEGPKFKKMFRSYRHQSFAVQINCLISLSQLNIGPTFLDTLLSLLILSNMFCPLGLFIGVFLRHNYTEVYPLVLFYFT